MIALFVSALPGSARADDPVVARFKAGDEEIPLAASDFADAAPVVFETGSGLAFRLSTDAEAVFADLTERNIGQRLSFHVCGKLIVEAVIQARLSGRGQIALADAAQAVHYTRILRGEIPC